METTTNKRAEAKLRFHLAAFHHHQLIADLSLETTKKKKKNAVQNVINRTKTKQQQKDLLEKTAKRSKMVCLSMHIICTTYN